ncbi:MotA/TolQ/ExbB proton channel family protein [Kineobactrum salinum]|uniref:MotA/TolQ/ExbB proton channel family protein n=1 Tax=Kineobactrum salinum TaxID=2708301 RepID=A0A6C0U2G0_9GAMM|nr:MotA/TolQ/ExbB proton channel family protein [Kineobactrum salinum]QIB66108.1 MotA/TolQ/ExbB proton channel family protein [Kineobactrum salinum]
MNFLELTMYEVARLFLVPVLLIISGLFVFAFVSLGGFVVEVVQRRNVRRRAALCPLRQYLTRDDSHSGVSSESLQLKILQLLEPLRVTTRIAPMLGLVATMIPLAPALLALGDGDLAQVGENLVVAFAAVIIALIAASITFLILTVRRRWLLDALHTLEREGVV